MTRRCETRPASTDVEGIARVPRGATSSLCGRPSGIVVSTSLDEWGWTSLLVREGLMRPRLAMTRRRNALARTQGDLRFSYGVCCARKEPGEGKTAFPPAVSHRGSALIAPCPRGPWMESWPATTRWRRRPFPPGGLGWRRFSSCPTNSVPLFACPRASRISVVKPATVRITRGGQIT